MKRIILIFCSFVSALFFFSGCGEEKSLTPAKETISGPLGQYFKVVNRSYKINNMKVNIEIERTDDGLPAPWVEGMEIGNCNNRVEPGFVVEFLDEDGDVIGKAQTNVVRDKDELVSVIALAKGEASSVPFSVIGGEITKFRVSSTFKYHEPVSKSSPSEGATTESSILDEVTSEYSDALKEAQKEMKNAYDEAAEEVKNAMNDAIKDLL